VGSISRPSWLRRRWDSITQRWIEPVIGDAIFIPSTALGEMTAMGRRIDAADIPFAVAARTIPGGGAFWGTQPISLEVPDPVQPALQSWKYYRQPLAVSLTDLWTNQASSPTGVLKPDPRLHDHAVGHLPADSEQRAVGRQYAAERVGDRRYQRVAQ